MDNFDIDLFANDNFCHYLNLDEFSYLKNNHKLGNLSILNINLRSLKKHYTELQSFLHSCNYSFAIIVITETWLNHNYDKMFHLENYNFFTLCRNECYGGIRIYYKNGINLQLLNDETNINNACEILSTRLLIGKTDILNIICIYRPPSGSLSEFTEYIKNLTNVKFKDSKCLFVGDLNADFFNLESTNSFNLFSNLFESSYRLLITKGTHVQGNRINSLIDHIITNLPFGHISTVFNYKIADHLPSAAFIETDDLTFKTVPVKFRNFSEDSIEEFLQDKSNLFEEFFNSYIENNNDVNEMVGNLISFSKKLCNKYFPVKIKKLGPVRFNSPWIDKKLLRCINKQNELQNWFNNGHINEKTLSNYKLLLQFAIEQSKKLYFELKFANSKNSKDSWKIINSLYGSKKNMSEEAYIDQNGSKINDNVGIANAFNNYFLSIPYETINDYNNRADSHSINKEDFLYLIPNNVNSIFMMPTHPDEIQKIIFSLSNNSILSEVPLKFIKLASYEYSLIMTRIINLIFECGDYPDTFKIAEIHPITKKKPSSHIVNNRPISILIVFDKILEKIMHERFYNFFIKNKIFTESQYGFMTGKGTDLAILQLLDYLYPGFSESLYILCLFIDFSKAFDCIEYSLLLAKLWRYGIRGIAYKLIKSFLSNRKQYVVHNKQKSDLGNITIGVPQGSCLGPLLFIIFVNDLFYLLKNLCNIVQYADDTALVKSSNNLCELVAHMNHVLYTLNRWCRSNSLCLNSDKTKAMVLTLRNYTDIPHIKLDENIIEYVTNIKYLGVYIDSKLNFNCHIDHLCKKLSMLSGITYYIGKYLTVSSAIKFYYAFIFSSISYCITGWGGNMSREGVRKLIERRHKKIVLNLFGKFENNNYDFICKKYSLLKTSDIYNYFLGLLTYKTINGNVPNSDLCVWLRGENSNDTHLYETRFRPEVYLPFPRINVIKNGYIYNSLNLWNSLNVDIKNSNTVNSFKGKLKRYFVDRY